MKRFVDKKRQGFIYKITNTVNGKLYIGKSTYKNLSLLIMRYKYEINKYNKFNIKIRLIIRAMLKYGFDSFQFEVIRTDVCESELNNLEIFYIQEYGANNKQIGYNLTTGGEGVCGYIPDAAARLKMSKARKGEKNNFFGKTHSIDAIAKIIESNKKRKGGTHAPLSEATKKRISNSKIGKPSKSKGKKIPNLTGINNGRYKDVDVNLFTALIEEGKKYKEICNIVGIRYTCFYDRLKKFNLEEKYYGTKIGNNSKNSGPSTY